MKDLKFVSTNVFMSLQVNLKTYCFSKDALKLSRKSQTKSCIQL